MAHGLGDSTVMSDVFFFFFLILYTELSLVVVCAWWILVWTYMGEDLFVCFIYLFIFFSFLSNQQTKKNSVSTSCLGFQSSVMKSV